MGAAALQLKPEFDSDFDADSREALKDRIMKATAVTRRTLAKKDRKAATAAGEAGAAKPKKAKKQKAAPAVGVTTGGLRWIATCLRVCSSGVYYVGGLRLV